MVYQHLETLKRLLEQQVATAIRLKKPFPDDVVRFELVAPVVTIGWPPRQLSGSEAQRCIPGIAIGLAEPVSDDGNELLLPIDLAVIVYNAGSVLPDGKIRLDDSGLHDLLDLMDIITRVLRQTDIIDGCLTLAEPTIKWQPVNEPVGDYWLGNILFTLSATPIVDTNEQGTL